MARIKITAKWLEAKAANPPAKHVDYFDSGTPGLSIRFGPKSSTWYYLRRTDGKLRRLMLGSYPATPFKAARAAVGDAEAIIAEGKSPKTEQARERDAKRESRAIDEGRIFRIAAEKWAAYHLPTVGKATAADYRRELDGLISEFGDNDIGGLKRSQLMRYLDTVKARKAKGRKTTTGLAANHAAVVIRQLFIHACDRLGLDNNPAAGIKNPTAPRKRSRTLDRHELRIVWQACERAGYPYGHALRFAICIGQRIGEVGAFRRDQIDTTGNYWKQAKNKADSRIDIFLASHARAILADCPNFGRHAPFFSASTDAKGDARGLPSHVWSKALKRHIEPHLAPAAEELGLSMNEESWKSHDLRRSMRSGITGWAGVLPDVAERTINHAIGGVRGIYDHADYRPHVAAALQRWDSELTAILNGDEPTAVPPTPDTATVSERDNVVALAPRRKSRGGVR